MKEILKREELLKSVVFFLLTGTSVSWKIKNIITFSICKLSQKNNIEAHENLLALMKKA